MNKSIIQDTQNDNYISKTIRRIFTRLHLFLENRESNDERSLGEILLYFSAEMVDAFMDAMSALLKSKLQTA